MQLPTLERQVICAISTPPGIGGIAVIRISGDGAIAVADKIWQGKRLADAKSHTAHLGTVLDSQGQPLDQAVATVYVAPASFTGDDVVEFSVHGSRYVQRALVDSLISAGARLAEPGEFTRRAFAAGKMDLAEAEAVADIIASDSRAAHRIAMNQMRGGFSKRLRQLRDQLLNLTSLLELELDFSEEDVEFASRQQLLALAQDIQAEVLRLANSFHAGSAIKNGVPVAIVGATNAGKSSLLNILVGDDRAIVSDIHGTTRDVVEDTLYIGDYAFRIMDTAGLRDTSDQIESMGMERSLRAASQADIILYVIDAENPVEIDFPEHSATVIRILNKIDRIEMADGTASCASDASLDGDIRISALTGAGIDELRLMMERIARDSETAQSSVLVTNARHYQALRDASQSIAQVIDAINANLSGDLISLDIRLTISHLSSILGDITASDTLASIFSRFCIGK